MNHKSLLLSLFLLPLTAEEKPIAPEKIEHVRVVKEPQRELLQTSIVSLEKNGVSLDLIGAVHIADKVYYEQLNEKFKSYDRVLFEMVGGEKLGIQEGENEKADDPKNTEHKKNKLSGLHDIYTLAADTLKLTGQAEIVDYHAKNFVHADMTMEEFSEKQEARHESFLTLILKAQLQAILSPPKVKQPDASALIYAYLAKDADIMKLQLIDTLGAADDQVGLFTGETVIVTDRNEHCLNVLEKQAAEGHKKIAIFYGAAHLSGMEKSLTEKGWKVKTRDWLTAWNVPVKKLATPAK